LRQRRHEHNGKNGLACLTNMRNLPGTIVLKPLPRAAGHPRT
jgi:succinate dehydrogenase/fumarate reductase-like Fe-S protein